MALKLNKSIKIHIAQMAVREKFQCEFDVCYENVVNALSNEVYKQCNGVDFESLPESVMSCVRSTNNINIQSGCRSFISDELCVTFGVKDIGDFKSNKPFYGSDYRHYLRSTDGFSAEYTDLKMCVKESQKLFDALIDSMESFKSAAKMFAALPWSEKYYPESEKKPTCNIVPVTTINKANELMGVSTDEAKN